MRDGFDSWMSDQGMTAEQVNAARADDAPSEHVHRFECGDTPGTFYCPDDGWTAHYSREDRRYCIHPENESEPAFLVTTWEEVPDAIRERGLA